MVVATSRNQLLAFCGGKPVAAYKAHVAGSAISKVRPPSLRLRVCPAVQHATCMEQPPNLCWL